MAKDGITRFFIVHDIDGIKVIQIRNDQIIKMRYALDEKDAQIIRNQFVNEFWGFALN